MNSSKDLNAKLSVFLERIQRKQCVEVWSFSLLHVCSCVLCDYLFVINLYICI